MPEMGGVALLRSIRENGLTIPVVFMTGHPMQAELEKLKEDGLAAWLFKPPRLKQLAMLIEQVLK
jgi:CheY-like chemotaxis protein